MTTIHNVPLDIWGEIGRFLPFRHVLRLYFCGNRRINEILTKQRVVTDVEFVFARSRQVVNWVPLLSEFRHIHRFVYNMGEMNSPAYYFPCQSDLLKLGPSLRDLELLSDGAEHAFFEAAPWDGCSYGPSTTLVAPLRMSDVWPNLASLFISQFSSYKKDLVRLDSAMEYLPATLRHFYINYENDFPLKYVPMFPRGLEYLEIASGALATSAFQDLPPALLSLNVFLTAGFNLDHWRSLPPTLTSLVTHNAIHASDVPDIIPVLPKGLIYIDFDEVISLCHFDLIPQFLPALQGLVFASSEPISAMGYQLDTAMRYVKYIRTANNHTFYSWDKLEWVPVTIKVYPWESPYSKSNLFDHDHDPEPALIDEDV